MLVISVLGAVGVPGKLMIIVLPLCDVLFSVNLALALAATLALAVTVAFAAALPFVNQHSGIAAKCKKQNNVQFLAAHFMCTVQYIVQ